MHAISIFPTALYTVSWRGWLTDVVPYSSLLILCLAMVGKFVWSLLLCMFRNYFLHDIVGLILWCDVSMALCWQVRSIIGDFAVLLSVVTWSIVDFCFGISTPKLNVPAEFKPTNDNRYTWRLHCFEFLVFCAEDFHDNNDGSYSSRC